MTTRFRSQTIRLDKSRISYLFYILFCYANGLCFILSLLSLFFFIFFKSLTRILLYPANTQSTHGVGAWKNIKRSLTATQTDHFGYGTVYMIKVKFNWLKDNFPELLLCLTWTCTLSHVSARR